MAKTTPLRYPGGKARLFKYFSRLIALNELYDCKYVETFCGGAALAVELLRAGLVSSIRLNDLDRAVYAFWHCAVFETDSLCERIEKTPVDMHTWFDCREIYRSSDVMGLSDLGFATFFLNRTNRSGILSAGVIGGQQQDGPWKLDARYNKPDLLARIRAIGRLRSRIEVSQMDAIDIVKSCSESEGILMYIDPPYVDKGPGLYLNAYTEQDHRRLAEAVQALTCSWVVSYDDNPLIREIYKESQGGNLQLHYSAQEHKRVGQERIYFSKNLTPPNMEGITSKHRLPWAA